MKTETPAPNFTLLDQNNMAHTLADYKGKWVLLYFYPKDDTPGCTTEACQIRDSFADFKKQGIVVLGVSCDTPESHAKFIKKFKLPFTLLADVDKKVVEAYEVWGAKSFMGRKYMGIMRTSFLINPVGKIAKVYEKVKPDVHAAEILADFNVLRA